MSHGKTLHIHRNSPIDYYRRTASALPEAPTAPTGLSIVSGSLAQYSLAERLAREGIRTDFVRPTTVEDLAASVIRAHRDAPVDVLDRSKRTHAIAQVLRDADVASPSTPLEKVAAKLPYDETDIVDQLEAELTDYYRCVAGTADHDALASFVTAVDEPHLRYAVDKTTEYLRAFRAIDDELAAYTDENTFVTRNHMDYRASQLLEDVWDEVYPDVEWVTLSTVSVLDNPTVRLLLNLVELDDGPDVHLFAGAGTFDTFRTRLAAIADTRAFSVEVADPDPDLPTQAGETLVEAAAGDTRATLDDDAVRFVEVPDHRREIEYALQETATLLDGDVAESDVLIAGREALTYQTAAENVAPLYNQPVYVESRRETQYMAAYTLLESLLELLGTPDDEEIGFRTLFEPVFAGLVVPDANAPAEWPIPDPAIRAVKDQLGDAPGPNWVATFDEWRDAIAATPAIDDRVREYVRWVADRRDQTPSPDDLRTLLDDCLDAYIEHTLPDDAPDERGPFVAPNRVEATRKHVEFFANRIRQAVGNVAEQYDWLTSRLPSLTDGWDSATRAFHGTIGDADHGLPDDDARSVHVIDAGNAYFRTADHVFVMGLATRSFPTEGAEKTFIHPELRARLHEQIAEYPYLYLDCDAAQFERDLDMYEAALRTSRDRITLVRPYKDEDGRDVAQSPFLDAIEFDGARERIGLDEPLPALTGSSAASRRDLWDDLAEKDRARVLAYFTGEDTGATGDDAPTQAELDELADAMSDPEAADRLERQIERVREAWGDAADSNDSGGSTDRAGSADGDDETDRVGETGGLDETDEPADAEE